MTEIATFAAGCYWCSEAIFQQIKGISSVIAGFTGGNTENPTYWDVATGKTRHAEAIQIVFDPKVISYQQLLSVFWSSHDPTSLNRQGYDQGDEYRSAIFYHNDRQQELAEESQAELTKANIYDKPIVTEIVPFTKFYPAEEYDQNFYTKNPDVAYCELVINPKLEKLRQNFSHLLK